MFILLLAACLVMGSGLLLGIDPARAADPQRLTVDILKIEGEQFFVKDETGREGEIHVGNDTEQFGRFKPGDRIDAWVLPNGHARTLMIVRSAPPIEEDRHPTEEAQR